MSSENKLKRNRDDDNDNSDSDSDSDTLSSPVHQKAKLNGTSSNDNENENEFKFQVGFIADVQYADKEDGYNFDGSQLRRYRQSWKCLETALEDFNACQKIRCVIQLGDLLDGHNMWGHDEEYSRNIAEKMFNLFPEKLDRIHPKENVHHVIGNHELYCLTRPQLLELTHPHYSYHSFSPYPGWTFIVLDSFDLSIMQPWRLDDNNTSNGNKLNLVDETEIARSMIKKVNENDIDSSTDWSKGLVGLERRFVPFNGGFSDDQLSWLDATLKKCVKMQNKVVIFSHGPLFPISPDDDCLALNYENVLDILYKHSDLVKLCLTGHTHANAYSKSKGIHFVRVSSPLSATPDDPRCHGFLHINEKRIKIEGLGCMNSYDLFF